MEEKGLSIADAMAIGNRNNDSWGNMGSWWIIIFILFFAFGGRGFGYGNNSSGAADNYVLASDFANIERKIDGVNNGLCDGFYAQNTNMLTGFNRNANISTQGFAGLNTAIIQDGYQTRGLIQENTIANMQNANAIQTQLGNVNYNIATQANNLANQFSSCCCETGRQMERGFCDTNYNMATQNANTLSAIDKVGDRIIDYLANEKVQTLRDENQSLRLAASQCAQNAYLIEQLKTPSPVPAYNVPSPYSYGTTCGCM